jgi:hypothetical protein
MFKKSKTEKQLNLETTVSQRLEGSAYKQYSDIISWQNIFYTQITSKIDEKLFSCLFSDKMGAPNASIRVLIAMMILKEGHGWSDLVLFENCRFNLLVRKALGLINIDESIPSESTYYLLRKHIVEYKKETKIDLFSENYNIITKAQIAEFQVSGKSIRFDSKLIGSDIATYSRFEIIHRTLCLYIKGKEAFILNLLSQDDQKQLKGFVEEDSSKTIYRSTKEQIIKRLSDLGNLIYKILNISTDKRENNFQILERVFSEQFNIQDNNQIEIKPKEEISAKSIQSPHDTECHYRTKNNKQVKGFSHNVTETCNKGELNLITDIQTEPASIADNDFVKTSIENTKKLLTDNIENVHADGAYNSSINQDYTDEKNINFYLTGMQGYESRYDLTNLQDKLQITDKQTGKIIEAILVNNNKFRIHTEKGYRYFGEKEIEKSNLRKQIEQLPVEIKNIRNNVEATIYQLAYYLRKDKTRYRGLDKNKAWAICRCLWINFVRIAKRTLKNIIKTKNNVQFYLLYIYIIFFNGYNFLNCLRIERNFKF